jgi:hypothetical protein
MRDFYISDKQVKSFVYDIFDNLIHDIKEKQTAESAEELKPQSGEETEERK